LNRKGGKVAKDSRGQEKPGFSEETGFLESGFLERPLLAEDCLVLAFASAPEHAEWLDSEAAESLLQAVPEANIAPEQASEFVRKVEEGFDLLLPMLQQAARQRGETLLEAHQRVRKASKIRNVCYRVEPQLPPDVLGIYIYLPKVS
jgi:hypothetical protein